MNNIPWWFPAVWTCFGYVCGYTSQLKGRHGSKADLHKRKVVLVAQNDRISREIDDLNEAIQALG